MKAPTWPASPTLALTAASCWICAAILSDAAYYEANFPAPILEALGYGGFPDAYTVTGPYVNKTLFDQAGVEMPGEGATWADWTEATTAGRRSHRRAVRHLRSTAPVTALLARP